MYTSHRRAILATSRQNVMSCRPFLMLLGRLKTMVLDSRGALLIDSIVAIGVVALIGAAVLASVSSSRTTGSRVEYNAIAEKVGRNQMEYVFSLPYQNPNSTPYPTVVPPQGYSVTVVANEFKVGDTDIEKIIVNVLHGNQNILLLETLRAKEQ